MLQGEWGQAVYVVSEDRRQPGRLAKVSFYLIPLLRNLRQANAVQLRREQAGAEAPILARARRANVTAARWIVVASVLGLAMWVGTVLVLKQLWGL